MNAKSVPNTTVSRRFIDACVRRVFFYRTIPSADSTGVASALCPSPSAGLHAYISFTNELPLVEKVLRQAAIYFIAKLIVNTQQIGLKSGRQGVNV